MGMEEIAKFGTRRHRRMTRKQLSPWAQQAVEHWRKNRPKMYAQLFQSGELHERAEKAAQQTDKEYQDGITNGMLPHESWEAVRERYLFVPAEVDVPLLGENPNGYESS
jgi:hypothetical protein